MAWEKHREYDHGVVVKVNKDSNPVTVALFDEGEMVGDPIAALQETDKLWEAKGYSKAKERYKNGE